MLPTSTACAQRPASSLSPSRNGSEKTVFESLAKSSTDSDRWKPPDTWVDSNEILVEVTHHEDEYWEVHEKLRESMSDAFISKLWRVQNSEQWANYILHKMRLEMQGVPMNEIKVWHGTSSLDPKVIYSDRQDGFMMQYAQQGLWGFGTYFAEKSSYSDNYAFKGGTQTTLLSRSRMSSDEKEMFLVTMLEGRSVYLSNSDRSLRVPPEDPVRGQRYNSVSASTGGSTIWVVYENGRAYPSYLVRYYRGCHDRVRTPFASRPPLPFEWQYEDGDHGWTPYASQHQTVLEKAWKGKQPQVIVRTPHFRYEIEFATMTQTNISIIQRTARKVRRRDIKAEKEKRLKELHDKVVRGAVVAAALGTFVLFFMRRSKR